MSKVVVVTGANKGIGFSVVKLVLQKQPDWTVILCSRDIGRGQKAVETLKNEHGLTAHLRILDVDSLESIQSFRKSLEADFPQGIDILINNAGIFSDPKQADSPVGEFKFNVEVCKATVRTNFFGSFNVCEQLSPLMKKDGRIINVSSRLSQTIFMHCSHAMQNRIRAICSLDEAVKLMEDFQGLDPELYEKEGWLGKPAADDCLPGYALGLCLPYGVAKVGINLLTKFYQQKYPSMAINAMCPGDAATDMVPGGKQSADESADTIVFLALQPDGEAMFRGQFLAERKPMDFFMMTEDEMKDLLAIMS